MGGPTGDEHRASDSEDPDRWLADQRVAEAARERRREASLRQQAAEEGTLRGVLVDLGEHARAVVVRGSSGREHRGRIDLVADDFIAVRSARNELVLLRLDALVWVRATPGSTPSVGDRRVASGLAFQARLQTLAVERPEVVVATTDGQSLGGRLGPVGVDVVTVRRDDGDRTTTHVPIDALAEVVVLDPASLA